MIWVICFETADYSPVWPAVNIWNLSIVKDLQVVFSTSTNNFFAVSSVNERVSALARKTPSATVDFSGKITWGWVTIFARSARYFEGYMIGWVHDIHIFLLKMLAYIYGFGRLWCVQKISSVNILDILVLPCHKGTSTNIMNLFTFFLFYLFVDWNKGSSVMGDLGYQVKPLWIKKNEILPEHGNFLTAKCFTEAFILLNTLLTITTVFRS